MADSVADSERASEEAPGGKIERKLLAMMFLQFFVWGAWYVSFGVYLRNGVGYPEGLGTAYGTGPLAAMISPLLLGLFADRYFPTQKALGFCHLLGAPLLLLLPWSIEMEMAGTDNCFFYVLLAYLLLYMPTLGLSNTVVMKNMANPEADFPKVRVFGTVGWILAGWTIGGLEADETALPFQIAAVASVALGLLSFTLPHTPPPMKGKKVSAAQALGLGALSMFRSWRFSVFAIASLLLCIPLQAYYAYTATFMTDAGFESATQTMTWGQISEVLFMLIIPFCFRHLGVKMMLVIAMGCWVLRYALFAMAAPESVLWMIFLGVLLHGICYDFFFVTGQIYTDRKAPMEMRGQAQGLLVVLTQGVGMWMGALINQAYFQETVSDPGQVEPSSEVMTLWPDFWWMPAFVAGGILFGFILTFRGRRPVMEEVGR